LGPREPLGHPGTAADHLVEQRGERALATAHRARVHHAAHAGDVAAEGDPPEPAVVEDVDPDVALFAPGEADGAAKVGEERDLAEVGNALAPARARGQEAVAAAGVDEEPGARGLAGVAGGQRDSLAVERQALTGAGLVQVSY